MTIEQIMLVVALAGVSFWLGQRRRRRLRNGDEITHDGDDRDVTGKAISILAAQVFLEKSYGAKHEIKGLSVNGKRIGDYTVVIKKDD